MTRWAKIMPRGACWGHGFHRGTQGSECTSTSRWYKIRRCLPVHRWSWGTKRSRSRKLRCSAGHGWLRWGSWWSKSCHSVCNKDDGDEKVGTFGADSRSILVVSEWKLACRPAPSSVGRSKVWCSNTTGMAHIINLQTSTTIRWLE